MPLKRGKSKKVIGENIGKMLREYEDDGMMGTSEPKSKAKAVKQAAVIAYAKVGKSRKKMK